MSRTRELRRSPANKKTKQCKHPLIKVAFARCKMSTQGLNPDRSALVQSGNRCTSAHLGRQRSFRPGKKENSFRNGGSPTSLRGPLLSARPRAGWPFGSVHEISLFCCEINTKRRSRRRRSHGGSSRGGSEDPILGTFATGE